MFVRQPFTLVIPLAALAVAAYAQQPASPPKLSCQPAITAAEYERLSEQDKQKYRAVEAGADQGKYKPRYLELVNSGPCQGQYANPCGHGISTELVDTLSCSALREVFRSNKVKPVGATEARKQQSLSADKKKRLEKISDGPDAGKFKPKYYERIKTGPSAGRYANPCGHTSRSTEEVDSNSCGEIQRLVREAR